MISEGITDLLSKGTPYSWLKMKCGFEISTISINAVKITLLFKKKARKMRSSMLWMCHLELHRFKVDGRIPTYFFMIVCNCPFRDFYFTDLSKVSKFMFFHIGPNCHMPSQDRTVTKRSSLEQNQVYFSDSISLLLCLPLENSARQKSSH